MSNQYSELEQEESAMLGTAHSTICRLYKRALVPSVLAATMFALPGALACPCAEVIVPPNIDKDPDVAVGVRFSHTTEYKNEFEKAVDLAKEACKKHIGKPNIAIISDIDETLLDNREFYSAHPEFHWQDFTAWINQANAPVLKPTADLLSWARSHGFAVFLITGRYEKLRPGTIRNLVKREVAYDGLYLRPNGDKRDAITYKSKVRQSIEEMGFQVVLNIGDQYSDLLGGYSQECTKLPNKMYYIP